MKSYVLYRHYKETEDGKLVRMTDEELEERKKENLEKEDPFHLEDARWIPVALVIGFLLGFWLG